MGTSASPESSYEVPPNVDITRLALSQEEGVVVARMLGRRVTLSELIAERVLTAMNGAEFIERLVKKGALLVVAAAHAPRDVSGTYGGVTFSPVDLAESVDLTEDQKKRILFFEMHLHQWSHYKLLGLSGKATPDEVKANFYRASKEFHPDAYFRKRLGSYQQRLDKIFRAMKSAYDVLSSPDKRAAYDAKTVVELTPDEQAEAYRRTSAEREERLTREREERNAQRMREQRLKKNPLTERLRKGRELIQLAEEANRKGKIDDAAQLARLAVTYDAALSVQSQRLILESEKLRGMALSRKLEMYFASGAENEDFQEEIERLLDEAAAIATATRDPGLVLSTSKLMFRAGKLIRAAKLAQFATELDEKNPRVWEHFSEIAAADAKWALTLKGTERWLALEPRSRRAMDLQRDARQKTGASN